MPRGCVQACPRKFATVSTELADLETSGVLFERILSGTGASTIGPMCGNVYNLDAALPRVFTVQPAH